MNEKLVKAYNIVNKYGISLNSFGPFLSYIDNKIGICLSIKEKNYGVLTRNISFENIEDFEDFLKKYANFRNASGNPSITFDNYESCCPKLLFSNEISNDKMEKIKSDNISVLKDILTLFNSYFNDLFNYRLVKLQKREKSLINAHYALNEYMKNLHRYYGQEYEYDNYVNDDVIAKFEEKYRKYLNVFQEIENHMFDEYNLELINNDFQKIVNLFREFEVDEEFFDQLFDVSICQNRLVMLDEMNKLVVSRLESGEERDFTKLKEELDVIKESKPFTDNKDSYIKSQVNDIKRKYDNFVSPYYYNFINYVHKKDDVVLDEYQNDDFDTVERLDGVSNDDTILLFSPLRTIMSHILLDLSIDKNGVDYSEYLPIYNEIKEKVELPINVLVAQRYFKDVNFDSFNSFIDSLTIICKKIFNLEEKYDFSLVDDEICYSYDFNTNYIFCSNKIIKDANNDVSVLKLLKGTKVFYNAKKIVYNPKDNNNLIVVKNDDYVIDTRVNEVSKISNEIVVNDFVTKKEEIVVNDKSLTVVMDIKPSKQYHFKHMEIK